MTAHTFDAVRLSPFYKSEHEAFRQSLRRFVGREIEPYANDWDEAGAFPRELYKKAAEVGYMGLGFPEAYGGLCHVVVPRARSVGTSGIVRPPRQPSGTWSAPQREARGAFGLR